MKTLLTKANLEAHVASKEAGRYTLCSLLVDSSGVQSTDGRILLRTPLPSDPVCDFPEVSVNGVDPDDAPVLIPISSVAKVSKRLPKNPRAPILGMALLESGGDKFRLVTTDLETEESTGGRSVTDHTFPDVSGIWESQSERTLPVSFTVSVLKRLVQAAEKAGSLGLKMRFCPWEDEPRVPGQVRDQSSAIAFEFDDGSGEGVIMPHNS